MRSPTGLVGRAATVSILLLALPALSSCASLNGRRWGHPVHVSEAVALSQRGVAPDDIVAKMNRSGIVYHLTDAQYAELRKRGVTPRVIAYMKATYAQAVEAHPKLENDHDLTCWYLGYDGYWYGGGRDGFHPDC